MTGDKWYESIQHCLSPCSPAGVFCGEVYLEHFYLAYTLMTFLWHHRGAAFRSSYVDDTKLVISFKMKDSSEAFADLRDHLQRIGQWCSKNNLLVLNLSKTKLMVFGSRQMHPRLATPRLTFKGRELLPEHTAEDVEVILDINLTYDERITRTVCSCMSCLSQISRTKHVLTNALY